MSGIQALPAPNVNIKVNDYRKSGDDVSIRHSQGSNGEINIEATIRDAVNSSFSKGEFDGAMSQNFGVNRTYI